VKASRRDVELFVLSATALYFELLVVRWTNAYVKNVGFFTNFLVLASFVGLGSGLLLAKRKETLLPALPLVLLLYCGLVHVARPALEILDPGALFWGEYTAVRDDPSMRVDPEVFVSVAFVVVALMFSLLGQAMGRLFDALPPLRAYAVNIAGSILGIALFTAGSFVLVKPAVWFSLVLAGVLGLCAFGTERARRDALVVAGVLSVAIVGFVAWLDIGSTWSPYYRSEVKCAPSGDCALAGNGIWGMQAHRFIPGKTLYNEVYGESGIVKKRRYERVLVIGSGAGNDVAVALHFGAAHVDAVEINPLALDVGRALHPDRPYSSPRVTTYNDDGRAFLRSTNERYDLVVYALPDSTGTVSGHANMRMESYLFTVEAFRAVRTHLAPDGVFAVYNHFREPWLVAKLANMLTLAFDEPPLVFSDPRASAVLMAGPGVRDIQLAPPEAVALAPPPATDDWPFLYLARPHLPQLYARALAAIAVLSVVLVAAFAWLAARAGDEGTSPPRSFVHTFRIDGAMFFMGAAFMLLEAKSIVTFGLLFGTTWLTTALVIAGILTMVLAGIAVTKRAASRTPWPWAVALGLALAFVYVVPPERLVLADPTARYVVGTVAALSPVMFANVIFARLLGESKETPRSLASNLLGSVAGGIAEYLSLVTGHRALLIVVAVLYAAAFALVWLRTRRSKEPARLSPA